VTTESSNVFGASLNKRSFDRTTIVGVETAMKFARFGRLISAIKYIEVANLGISRETAKMIVRSFGYGGESRWQELEKWPEQDGQSVRCL
jgi:hypothetical protein